MLTARRNLGEGYRSISKGLGEYTYSTRALTGKQPPCLLEEQREHTELDAVAYMQMECSDRQVMKLASEPVGGVLLVVVRDTKQFSHLNILLAKVQS